MQMCISELDTEAAGPVSARSYFRIDANWV